jgi:hypothetical protein
MPGAGTGPAVLANACPRAFGRAAKRRPKPSGSNAGTRVGSSHPSEPDGATTGTPEADRLAEARRSVRVPAEALGADAAARPAAARRVDRVVDDPVLGAVRRGDEGDVAGSDRVAAGKAPGALVGLAARCEGACGP